MTPHPTILWTQHGAQCRLMTNASGLEVVVFTDEAVPIIRKAAHSRSDARNEAEYLRVLLERSRDAVPTEHANPPLVLIVEDDLENRSAYEEILKLDGFRPVSVATLADARCVIGQIRPLAVLLDHLLPDGDGVAFCAEIRSGLEEALPIVLVTGLDRHYVESPAALGPDAVLTKPCRPEILTSVIKLLVQRRKVPAAQAAGSSDDRAIVV